MKNTTKASPWLLLTVVISLFTLTACHNTSPKDPNLLVVERQTIYLDWDASITVDKPIAGPEYLQDSINKFFNEKIHEMYLSLWECDEPDSVDPDLIFDKMMYDVNGTYFELDFFQEAFYDVLDIGVLGVTFGLIAQTESFVTYGIEYYGCGLGCASSMYCQTFSKKDGHRIANLITWDDILRFINDHPDAKHPFGQWQIEANNKEQDPELKIHDAGLTEKGLLVVNEDEVNHYIVGIFAYEDVLPYLSQDAQELVKDMGEIDKYTREDWYMGSCIGTVGDIKLMQREPMWRGFPDFNHVEDSVFQVDKVYSLTAYTMTDDQFVPQKVFDLKAKKGNEVQHKWAKDMLEHLNCKQYTSRLEFEFPNVAWNGPTIDEEIFITDENVLFVPYKKKDYEVDLIPFKYDGKHFKIVNAEETKPEGQPLGTIELDEEESIYLKDDADGYITAYHVWNNMYIPTSAFPYHSKKEPYFPCDEPMITSNPNHGYTAFDPVEEKLYTAIAERTSMGGYGCFDRYYVLHFDGEKFVYEGRDGGFWLHPSIRKFAGLAYMGKSEDYLVRIDEMRSYNWRELDGDEYEFAKTDTCRYRLALWKGNNNMSDAPYVVIENGCNGSEGFVFMDNDYKYVIAYDEDGGMMEVYKGDQLFTKQNLKNMTNTNY